MTRKALRLGAVVTIAITIAVVVACLFVLYEMAYINAD